MSSENEEKGRNERATKWFKWNTPSYVNGKGFRPWEPLLRPLKPTKKGMRQRIPNNLFQVLQHLQKVPM